VLHLAVKYDLTLCKSMRISGSFLGAICGLYFSPVKRLILTPLLVCVLVLPLLARGQTQPPAAKSVVPVASHPIGMAAGAQAELVKSYCTGCHNDRSKAGELTLVGWDVTRAAAQR